MRVCCACLFLGARRCLVPSARVSFAHARVYVVSGVHAHACVLRVLAFVCAHALALTCACFLDARVGVCA
jgi:hypothetical protein